MGNSEVHTKIRKDGKTADLVQIALCAVLIAVCSWITIPAQIPFTLQTLAIFTALGILGGKKGTIAIAIYILLGLWVFLFFQISGAGSVCWLVQRAAIFLVLF